MWCMQDSNGGPQTWHDCFKCWHMFFNRGACNRMEERPVNDCSPESLNYVQVSNYAAQLAWWLAFFPPEQFLILTSAELHDPDRQVNVRAPIVRKTHKSSEPVLGSRCPHLPLRVWPSVACWDARVACSAGRRGSMDCALLPLAVCTRFMHAGAEPGLGPRKSAARAPLLAQVARHPVPKRLPGQL